MTSATSASAKSSSPGNSTESGTKSEMRASTSAPTSSSERPHLPQDELNTASEIEEPAPGNMTGGPLRCFPF